MQVTTPWQTAGDPSGWRRMLALAIGLLAVVLAGSALVSWVAAHWPRMEPHARLALVQGVLALVVVLAAGLAWRGGRGAGLLTGAAALATGALLALVGQIYQTGADRWQLFLLWAVLITPWLLLVRSVFLTLLWVALLNLAVWLAAALRGVPGSWAWLDVGPAGTAWWLVGLDAGLLVLAEYGHRFLRDPWHLVRRALALAVLGWAFGAGLLHSLDSGNASPLAAGLLLGLVPVAVLYAVYGHGGCRDLGVVALSLLTGIGLFGAWGVQMLDSIDAALGLAVLLLALSWLAARHLLRLRQATGNTSPWYLIVLRVGALIPVLLLLGVWVAASFELDSAADALAAGVMLTCSGLLMDRLIRGDAWRQAGEVLAMLGLLLCVVGVVFLMDGDADRLIRVLILLLIGGIAYVGVRRFSARLMVAGLTLGAGFWLTSLDAPYFIGQADLQGVGASHLAWRLWVFLAAGSGLWIGSLRADRRAIWGPLAWALMAMAAGVALLLALSMPASAREWPWFGQLAIYLCALLPGLLLAAWLAATRPVLPIGLRVGLPLAVCIAGLGWVDLPTLSVALVWLVLGRLSDGRVLQVLAVPLGLLGLLLYGLDTQSGVSLRDKAMILGLTAAWLASMAVILVVRGRRGRVRPMGVHRGLSVGILAGGALVLGLSQVQVHRYETILSTGRPVVLALVPVDPRSLMQGDYMALDYAVRRAADAWLRARSADGALAWPDAGHGWLLLQPDAQGVWQLRDVLTTVPPSARDDQVALPVRWRHGVMDFGAGSWFFPEGQGARFAGARYGVLRVADDGPALLAGLLDERRQPL